MEIGFRSKFGLSLFYLIVAVLVEIMTFCMLGIGVLPKHYLYDFAIMLMFMGIIFLLPNYLAQYIFSMIMIVGQVVIMYVNYSLYHLYGDVFSFDMIKLFNETKAAITSDFTYVWLIIFLVGFCAAIGTIGFYIYKSLRVYKMPFHKNFSIFMIMVLLIVQGLGMSIYTQQSLAISARSSIEDENYVLSDLFLRDTTMLKIASLKSLGTYGYYMNNIMNLLSNTENEAVISRAVNYFNGGEIFDENSSNVFGVDEGNNVLVIMMESLEWFAFSDGTFNSYVFSEELTPNIYALMQEGFIATDFFSKSKTNISEGIGFLGSYPIGKYMNQVATNSNEKDFGFSMGNVLSKLGYDTGYYHGYNGDFYDRNKTHIHLGFDHVYFGDDANDGDIKWGHFPSEAQFAQDAIDYGELIPEGKTFYDFYTSLTTHGPYTNNKNSMNGDRSIYLDDVKASQWYQNMLANYSDDSVREYMTNFQASVIGLDKAIGVMVDRLYDLDIYDETTIVLYADHNAYYHGLSNYEKGIDATDYSNIELNTVPLIIKSAGLNERISTLGYYGYNNLGEYDSVSNNTGVFAKPDRYGNKIDGTNNYIASTDRFCSAYDIVPTIFDLLGVDFNTNLYPGNSIFSKLTTKVSVYDSVNSTQIEDYIVAYYSHTGGVYGRYGDTKDLNDYDWMFPTGLSSGEYKEKFKEQCEILVEQLNYVSTLYNYGVYSRL